MNCTGLPEFYTDYLEGTLGEEQRAGFEAHLRVCPHCADDFALFRRILAEARALEPLPAPASLRANVRQALEPRAPWWTRLVATLRRPAYAMPLAAAGACALMLVTVKRNVELPVVRAPVAESPRSDFLSEDKQMTDALKVTKATRPTPLVLAENESTASKSISPAAGPIENRPRFAVPAPAKPLSVPRGPGLAGANLATPPERSAPTVAGTVAAPVEADLRVGARGRAPTAPSAVSAGDTPEAQPARVAGGFGGLAAKAAPSGGGGGGSATVEGARRMSRPDAFGVETQRESPVQSEALALKREAGVNFGRSAGVSAAGELLPQMRTLDGQLGRPVDKAAGGELKLMPLEDEVFSFQAPGIATTRLKSLPPPLTQNQTLAYRAGKPLAAVTLTASVRGPLAVADVATLIAEVHSGARVLDAVVQLEASANVEFLAANASATGTVTVWSGTLMADDATRIMVRVRVLAPGRHLLAIVLRDGDGHVVARRTFGLPVGVTTQNAARARK